MQVNKETNERAKLRQRFAFRVMKIITNYIENDPYSINLVSFFFYNLIFFLMEKNRG